MTFTGQQVDERFKIYESSKNILLTKNLEINKIDKMYGQDTFLIPYFIHENYLDVASDLKTICKCANSFSNHDIFTKTMFDIGENSYNSTYSCIVPNYYLTKRNKKKWINIRFPLLLNRKSQSSVNLKKTI